jgi:3-phosphoshikimate 1-carboxyvinyltransferase
MALAVAGLAARKPTVVYGSEVTGDSFPGFELTLQALGAQLEERP